MAKSRPSSNPLALAVLNRVDLSTGFRLQSAPVAAFAGALVLGVSLWPFAHQVLVWLSQWEVIEFDPRTLAAAKQLIGKIQERSGDQREAIEKWLKSQGMNP